MMTNGDYNGYEWRSMVINALYWVTWDTPSVIDPGFPWNG